MVLPLVITPAAPLPSQEQVSASNSSWKYQPFSSGSVFAEPRSTTKVDTLCAGSCAAKPVPLKLISLFARFSEPELRYRVTPEMLSPEPMEKLWLYSLVVLFTATMVT